MTPKGHRALEVAMTLWPQRSRWPLWSIWHSLWPQKVTFIRSPWPTLTPKVTVTFLVGPSLLHQKVTRSLEVAMTYFMTPKVTVTFWSVWPSFRKDGVVRGRSDLLYDRKGQLDLWPWPWPRLWPQKVTGSLEVAMTYFMTPKVNLTFDLDLDPKVKHLTWQVTTDVQVTL